MRISTCAYKRETPNRGDWLTRARDEALGAGRGGCPQQPRWKSSAMSMAPQSYEISYGQEVREIAVVTT